LRCVGLEVENTKQELQLIVPVEALIEGVAGWREVKELHLGLNVLVKLDKQLGMEVLVKGLHMDVYSYIHCQAFIDPFFLIRPRQTDDHELADVLGAVVYQTLRNAILHMMYGPILGYLNAEFAGHLSILDLNIVYFLELELLCIIFPNNAAFGPFQVHQGLDRVSELTKCDACIHL
jgi:hypothetical protein